MRDLFDAPSDFDYYERSRPEPDEDEGPPEECFAEDHHTDCDCTGCLATDARAAEDAQPATVHNACDQCSVMGETSQGVAYINGVWLCCECAGLDPEDY